MRRFLTFGVLAGLAAGIFAAVPHLATAQSNEVPTGSGFRISPARIEETIERGASKTITIRVQNVTEDPKNIAGIVNDFLPAEDESGTPRLLVEDSQVDNPNSLKPFIDRVGNTRLAAGQERAFQISVAVPRDAAPGAYFGVIRFGLADEAGNLNTDSSAVALSASVGTVVLVNVPGEVVELMSLEQITATKGGAAGSFFESAPDKLLIRLENEGNSFVRPFGKVSVRNWSGDIVHEYELNSTEPRGNILPKSVRKFEDDLKNVGRFGRYTVEANIGYGDGGNIITARETFWILPWKTLLVALVILVVAGFFGARGVRRYNKSIVNRSKQRRWKR